MQFFSDVTRSGSKDHTEKFLYFLKTWVLFSRLFSREFDDDDDDNIDDDEWNLVEQRKPLSLISGRDHCQGSQHHRSQHAAGRIWTYAESWFYTFLNKVTQ